MRQIRGLDEHPTSLPPQKQVNWSAKTTYLSFEGIIDDDCSNLQLSVFPIDLFRRHFSISPEISPLNL